MHRVESSFSLPRALHANVLVAESRLLSPSHSNRLMSDVTEAEVLQAVAEFSHHKAADPDGLYYDFSKDTSTLLVPALVHVSN